MSSQWDYNPDYFFFRRRLDKPLPRPRAEWSWLDRMDIFWVVVLIGALLLVPVVERLGG